jgi:streptogramin lyase
MRWRYLLAGALLLLLAGAGLLSSLRTPQTPGCSSTLGGPLLKSQLSMKTFGAVTTITLPSPGRWPNALAVAQDGSVWFGEEAVPALAHLFPANGTVVEYAFPGAYPANSAQGYTCAQRTDVWGVALWDGRVWATDAAQNRLLGLSPKNDSFRVVPLSENGSLPFTLAPGPDGALWFTQVHSGEIGTLYANGTVAEHRISVPERINSTATVDVPAVPSQIVFSNSSTGYFVDASPLVVGSPVFAFHVAHFSVERVGAANVSLSDPDSIALTGRGIWLAQHADSSLAYYDFASGNWSSYPTSSVDYIGTTLPYFVESNGSLIWFNEHFGNRMGALDAGGRSLTEYSLTDPPAGNVSQLANALTMSVAGRTAWFTESTSNAIGFVNASYVPTFSVSTGSDQSISIPRGGATTLRVGLTGTSSAPLSIRLVVASQPGGVQPAGLHASADRTSFASLQGDQTIIVSLRADALTTSGRYVLLVTATDGLVSRSVYIRLLVP